MAATITQLSRKYEADVEYGSIKVVIPVADVRTLTSAPIEIIPAPAAGRAIILLPGSFARLPYVSAPYTADTTLTLLCNSTICSSITAFLTLATATGTQPFPQITGNDIILAATAIEVSATGGGGPNPENGDSILTLYVNYKIMTL